jgi:hypothetical protein
MPRKLGRWSVVDSVSFRIRETTVLQASNRPKRNFALRGAAVLSLMIVLLPVRVSAQVNPALALSFSQGDWSNALPGERLEERRVKGPLSRLQIPFLANESQLDPRVSYYASTFAGTVYVTRHGKIVYSLRSDRHVSRRDRNEAGPGWTLIETLLGGNPRPRGAGLTPVHASVFIGNDPALWKTDLATYESVSLGEVWPGIEVRLRAHGGSSEKLFVLLPGSSPNRICVRVSGARSLHVNSLGSLVADTELGEVKFSTPSAYQESGGQRRRVDVAYEVRGDRYGFRVGDYDPALAVVIDPLMQSTYLGGDVANALAIDPASGDVYVVGRGAALVRLNADLTMIKQATYVGAPECCSGTTVAIHPISGDIYVAGHTFSTDFPGTSGGVQPINAGAGGNAFVSRLNAGLDSLIQSTYLGGPGTTGINSVALAIHPITGDVFIAGDTDAGFPGAVGGAQPLYGGGAEDGFVARLNASLTRLNQATYLGGSSYDLVEGLAIHPVTNEVFVAGSTTSADLPNTAGGAQATLPAAAGSAFVARLNTTLTTLNQATYLGGSSFTGYVTLAIHPVSGEVYVAGATDSYGSSVFPRSAGGAQPTPGGEWDDFVARLAASLRVLIQSTYLGGSGIEGWVSLAVHPMTGEVFASGTTESVDFPGTAGGAQPVRAGLKDAFVARLTASLTRLGQATYLGGGGQDYGRHIGIHPTSGAVYVTGRTHSFDFPGTDGGAEPEYTGVPVAPGPPVEDTGFVARLTPDLKLYLVPAWVIINRPPFGIYVFWRGFPFVP